MGLVVHVINFEGLLDPRLLGEVGDLGLLDPRLLGEVGDLTLFGGLLDPRLLGEVGDLTRNRIQSPPILGDLGLS